MKIHLKLISSLLITLLIISCNSSVKESVVVDLYPVRNGFVYSYIDATGKIIIQPRFKTATVFRNGLALVQLFGSRPTWGFIQKDGTLAINAIYKESTVFSEKIAWVVSKNGAPKAINLKGDSLFSLKGAKSVRIFKDGLAAFSVKIDSVNVNWGFVDKDGTIVIPPQFTAVGNFSDGKCAVANVAGEWGYIDMEGKININYQYTRANDFIDGRASVQYGNEWGVIDEKGKFVMNPQFTDMKTDSDRYIIKRNNGWGWCDKMGKITIDAQYVEAYPFNGNELAPVKNGTKFGFINRKGKLIIEAQFEQALPFNGKIAFVMSGGKGGFIDKNARYIIHSGFEGVSEDLRTFLQTGGSNYESVETDYFDKDAIVNRLKTSLSDSTVEGMNFSTPMAFIYKKYNKSDANFIKNASEHKIISAERISNDATMDFFILGTPWNESYNGKLGFTYTLKPKYKLTGFSYRINLTSKGLGKEDEVLKSFETDLKGYEKDITHSDENVTILKSKFQLIVCLKQKGMIIVAVYPVTPENLHMVDVNYGNGMENDSTIVTTDSVKIK